MDKVVEAITIFIGGVLILGLLSILVACPVKWCWDYVMPYLFDLKEISLGQAWCLSFLSGVFFNYHVSLR